MLSFDAFDDDHRPHAHADESEEATTACTLNGAAAVNLSTTHGSIEVGKNADLVVAEIADHRTLAHHFGTNHVARIIKNGLCLEILLTGVALPAIVELFRISVKEEMQQSSRRLVQRSALLPE